MLKTCMTKKLEEMKNGGYTLFSDKVRKMLIAMGLSLLGIGTLSQVANAQVQATITHKRTIANENKVRYLMNLKETNDVYKLKGIYYDNDKCLNHVDVVAGTIEGQQETTVVIEVPDDTTEVTLKNNVANLFALADDKITVPLNCEIEDSEGQ